MYINWSNMLEIRKKLVLVCNLLVYNQIFKHNLPIFNNWGVKWHFFPNYGKKWPKSGKSAISKFGMEYP